MLWEFTTLPQLLLFTCRIPPGQPRGKGLDPSQFFIGYSHSSLNVLVIHWHMAECFKTPYGHLILQFFCLRIWSTTCLLNCWLLPQAGAIFKLNLLGWHWFVKIIFQVYNSTKHHLHTVWCAHRPRQSLSIPFFTCLLTSTFPPPPFPSGYHHTVVCVYVLYICMCVCVYFFFFA